MKAKVHQINFPFPLNYYFDGEGKKKMILLLHGYRMHARKAMMDFESMFPEEYGVLAPNAFFPIPKSDKSISRMGYSWYFEDHKSGKSLFTVKQASDTLYEFVKDYADKYEITLVGFSQGAIVGLSLASKIPSIKNLVLMSSAPLLSQFEGSQKLNILAFHGKEDEVIDFDYAIQGYNDLQEKGHDVQLHKLEKTGHNISQEGQLIKKEVLSFLKE